MLYAFQLDGSIIALKAPPWLFLRNTICYKSNLQPKSQRLIFYYSKGKRAKISRNGAFRCVKYHATSGLNPGQKIDIHPKSLHRQKNPNRQCRQCKIIKKSTNTSSTTNMESNPAETTTCIPICTTTPTPPTGSRPRITVIYYCTFQLSWRGLIDLIYHSWGWLHDLKRAIFSYFLWRDSDGHS